MDNIYFTFASFYIVILSSHLNYLLGLYSFRILYTFTLIAAAASRCACDSTLHLYEESVRCNIVICYYYNIVVYFQLYWIVNLQTLRILFIPVLQCLQFVFENIINSEQTNCNISWCRPGISGLTWTTLSILLCIVWIVLLQRSLPNCPRYCIV